MVKKILTDKQQNELFMKHYMVIPNSIERQNLFLEDNGLELLGFWYLLSAYALLRKGRLVKEVDGVEVRLTAADYRTRILSGDSYTTETKIAKMLQALIRSGWLWEDSFGVLNMTGFYYTGDTKEKYFHPISNPLDEVRGLANFDEKKNYDYDARRHIRDKHKEKLAEEGNTYALIETAISTKEIISLSVLAKELNVDRKRLHEYVRKYEMLYPEIELVNKSQSKDRSGTYLNTSELDSFKEYFWHNYKPKKNKGLIRTDSLNGQLATSKRTVGKTQTDSLNGQLATEKEIEQMTAQTVDFQETDSWQNTSGQFKRTVGSSETDSLRTVGYILDILEIDKIDNYTRAIEDYSFLNKNIAHEVMLRVKKILTTKTNPELKKYILENLKLKHIRYVCICLEESYKFGNPIMKVEAYIDKCLYNAPDTYETWKTSHLMDSRLVFGENFDAIAERNGWDEAVDYYNENLEMDWKGE